MLTSYLKISFRNIKRHKVLSLINVFGLSISLAGVLLLFQFINHELSFDKFNEHSHRIYRLISHVKTPDGNTLAGPLTVGNVSEELANRVPHIERVCRIDRLGNNVKYNENTYNDLISLRADSNFFKIFTFKALDGDPNKTLSYPGEVAITRSTAKKLFGDDYPIGKTIEINKKTYEVTSLLVDIPSTSHVKFDLITSFLDIKDLSQYINNRGVAFPCYFKTYQPISSELVEMEIIQAVEDISNVRMLKTGLNLNITIQNLLDIHLKSDGLQFDIDGTGNTTQIFLFSFIAFLLLAIATINFINLIIARSETRALEIGLRKVCGAKRSQIVTQFLVESVMVSVLSVFIALLLAEILLPTFGNLVEKNISYTLLTPFNILLVFSLGILTGLISGLYPAFYMSGFSTQKAFKGEKLKKQGLSQLQVSLVIFQFSIAIFLIACVITLQRQIIYVKGKNLGFNPQTYVLSNLTRDITTGYESIRTELERIPGVMMVSGSQSIPGRQSTIQSVTVEGQGINQSLLIQQNRVQDGYLETLGVPVILGRDFNPDLASDSSAFILNETAVKKLGLINPLGTKIRIHNLEGIIIGVTPDYHTRSLHGEIEPLAHSREFKYPYYILARINTPQVASTVNSINNVLKTYDPAWDISGRFINEFFDGQYRQDEKLNKLFFASSILSIIIAIMGLFALANFTTSRRTKEVGIRKTLGASTTSISVLLAWHLTRWVFLSCLIALPISWYAMDKYLLNFAYRVSQDFWVFIIAGAIGILLALVTVIGQTVKIAIENPIKALRYE